MIIEKSRKLLIDIAKKNSFFRNIIRKGWYLEGVTSFRIHTVNVKVDEKTVIFGCFDGRSYCDSPKAIYKEMLNNKKYDGYNFIWVFKNPEKHLFLEENKNTKVIKNSRKGIL